MRDYYITRIPNENEKSSNYTVSTKHDQLGIYSQRDEKSELMTRETSSGALIYNKPETVIIENMHDEENPGAYIGQWVSMNIISDPSSHLLSQGSQEMRHGRGTQIFPDGSIYEGYWC